ncbi:hypothetical protein BRC81_11745 [Halobacteriales archaeon QS_1_68_20]|nr:MAG: hypothetical protein BRC81_11745 [Halobacteriales archaeon QS_1_68_20]
MMRAAVLQDTLGIGGRSKVVAKVIELLAERADGIDVHTLASEADARKFRDHYGLDADGIDTVIHPGGRVPGTLYRQPLLNFLAREHLREYQFVFNSNNCLRFLHRGPEYVHYVHFPASGIPEVDPRYDEPFYRLASIPSKILTAVTGTNAEGQVFANSGFTSGYVTELYGIDDVEVLYPPSLERVTFDGFSGEGVVSLGSFHPNKRQLFQLRVAEAMPETEFRIVGSTSDEGYFQQCRAYVEDNDLKNVELFPDASNDRVEQLLDRSRVFLHSMENERFGIATVEGLDHGCVPVVHDSGGQREIVPDPAFRFRTRRECVRAIERASAGGEPDVADVPAHLETFSDERFQRRIRAAIEAA